MNPKLSILIPIHDMKGGAEFLWRSVNSLMEQTFQDFEIVITKTGKMAKNTNAAMDRARGEIIKILYLDDYLAHPDALKQMLEAFNGDWLICGVNNNPSPYLTKDIEKGNNKLGSPSALMCRRDCLLRFDENMSWLLDCDFYKRMYATYGEPDILSGVHVNIGEGEHQMTRLISDEAKLSEFQYMNKKYA